MIENGRLAVVLTPDALVSALAIGHADVLIGQVRCAGRQYGRRSPLIGAARVAFWGALAMAVTASVGWMFGAVA